MIVSSNNRPFKDLRLKIQTGARMPKRNKDLAKIDMVKAIAGVSFATLAAIGGASGNPMIAGLAALPAAGLSSYRLIDDQFNKLKSQNEKYLELPPPHWWTRDNRSWQELCTDIEHIIPQTLEAMQKRLQMEQRVITKDIVRQNFIEALVAQHLPWQPDFEHKRLIGEFIATPVLQKLDEILEPVIGQIQQEGALIDHRKTALHTEKTVQTLEKIYQEMSKSQKPQASSEKDFSSLRKQYCEALYNRWKMLDFRESCTLT